MIYLTGVTNDRHEPALIAQGVGLMIQRGNSYHLRADRYPFFAVDIGMGYSEADPYLAYVERQARDRCLFVVSPDAYPDAVESQRRGLEYAPLIREMGFPVAVVAQDDAERLTWPWEDLDALFIGGEKRRRDEWKVSTAAEGLVREARNAGKWVHMGRVNSLKRMKRAREMGCNSADGTFIKYRLRRRAAEGGGVPETRGAVEVGNWLAWLQANPPLPIDRWEAPSHPTHREAAQ